MGEELHYATPVEFRVVVGAAEPRGPVSNDYFDNVLCGLPPGQEEWDFPSNVDPGSSVVVVCLEFLSCRAHNALGSIYGESPTVGEDIARGDIPESELPVVQCVESTPAPVLLEADDDSSNVTAGRWIARGISAFRRIRKTCT